MKKSIINIGITGCGWIAQNAHIPALQKVENVQIISIFDMDMGKAMSTASKYNIKKVFNDYNSFLKSDIDGVIVCTPNNSHADYSVKALKSGKHVLCEKPITICSSDAVKILDIAAESKKLFIPGFVNRFREDIKKMNEIISNGEIGVIEKVKAGWLRRAGIPRPGTWFTRKALSGGGVLIDLGPHIIDLCLALLKGREVNNLELKTARNYENKSNLGASWFDIGEEGNLELNVEDTATACVRFDDGAVLELELSWLAPVKGDYTYFTVYGTKGTLELKTLFGFSNDRLFEKDLINVRNSDGSEKKVYFDRKSNNAVKAFEALENYFISSIRATESSYLTSVDGYNTVKLIESLYESEVCRK